MPEAPSAGPPPQAATRSWPQRALIWLLRRWWALAVLVIGGALTSQFGQVAQTIFNEILRGQAPSFNAVGTSWTQTLQTINVGRAIIIFSVAIAITAVAFIAERVESAREQAEAEQLAAQRRAAEKSEQRLDVQKLVEEMFQQQGQSNLDAGSDDEEEGEALSRTVALPPRPALVVGREGELERISTALTAPGATAVAIRGMGGVGKSTLLNEILHRQATLGAFPDGVIWLACQDLVEAEGAAQLYEAAASALGRGEVLKANGVAAKMAALRKTLVGRRILIGLDNIEQQLPLAQVIATLTPRGADGAGPVVVITTRASFANDLAGLREINLDELDPAAGFDLLQSLLVRAGRPLTTEDIPVARAIVTAIGALPLAIELVAPRIARRAEPLAALAARLQADGGVQLRGTTRGIERTFTDTYGQLDPDQQAAFSALSVFAGSTFGQEAAVAAISAMLGQKDADPQLLLDLCDLSLLREVPQPEGPPRYQLHPLLKQYARERLRERDEAVGYRVGLAVARSYRALAHRSSSGRRGYDHITLELEYPNIAGALNWAHEQVLADPQGERGREGDQLIGDLCGSLRMFLDDHGYWTDARRFLTWGIEADRRMGNHRREGTMLVALGFIVRQQGDLDLSERYYTEALNLARARHDQTSEGARIQNLGTVALMRRQYDRARTLYEQSLALRRQLGDRGGTSSVLRALGVLAAEEGRLAEARQYLREAIDLFQGRSRDVAFARTLRELAAVSIRDPEGDREHARQILEEALATMRRRNQVYDTAQTLDWLGTLDVLEGQPEAARTHWEESLAIYQRLGSNAAAQVRERLGRLAATPAVPALAR